MNKILNTKEIKDMLIKAKAIDIENNESNWDYIDPIVSTQIVKAPTISSPTNGAALLSYRVYNMTKLFTVPIVLSAFAVSSGTSTLEKREIKLCQDINGLYPVLETSVGNVTSTSLTLPLLSSIEKDRTYYLFCRDKSTTLGYSNWSNPISIRITDTVKVRGCTIYRHESNKGTVIEYIWADGVSKRRMVVADASFRNNWVQFLPGYGSYTSVSAGKPVNLPAYNLGNNYNWCITNSTTVISPKAVIASTYTNQYLYKNFSVLKSDGTAKSNCNVWIAKYGLANLPAIKYCRSKTIVHNSVNCALDIPNQYQSLLIFILSDYLDSIDPTAASYPKLKIGRTNTNQIPSQSQVLNGTTITLGAGEPGRFMGTRVYSSSMCLDPTSNYYKQSIVKYNSNCTGGSPYWYFGIIPILEI